ncbi:MAG: hypothetical protein JXR48_16920 [Candidatus Delongbacteria bacterium]|nr:hypothetical protein [Candidatus Delongbacteria bacterium]MBN2836640.1 hypothetical protein [Candidatus Delongbacteria bacterium]
MSDKKFDDDPTGKWINEEARKRRLKKNLIYGFFLLVWFWYWWIYVPGGIWK